MSRDPLTGESVRTDQYTGDGASLWGLPGDLGVVIGYTLVVWVVLGGPQVVGMGVIGPLGGVWRVVIGLPLLVFLPGYALLAALFPGRPSRNADRPGSLSGLSRRFDTARSIQQRGIQWGERAALSFGVTVFVIPPIALALDLVVADASETYVPPKIATALSVFVVVVGLIGVVRRLRLPREQRFAVPVGHWLDDLAGGFTGSLTDVVLNAVLLVSILTAVSTMAFALAQPNPGTHETTLDLATGPSNQPVAANFTTDFTEGESGRVLVNVVNHEQHAVDYTVVVQLQRIRDGTITQRRNLGRFSRRIPDDRTWQVNRTVTPEGLTGDDLRLAFLLYRGDPPDGETLSQQNTLVPPVYLAVNVSAAPSGG